jgi:hypothetical protein
LARDINPKVFSAHEWRAKLEKKDPFVTEVMTNPKIFLIGEKHDLLKTSQKERELEGTQRVRRGSATVGT